MPITNDIERLHGRISELEARVAALEGVADDGWIDREWLPYAASYPYGVPVEEDLFVDVMMGDGTFSYRRGPRSLNWSNLPPKSRRIIAYRIAR